MAEQRNRVRLGRLETVGAWLHLWTPPREAEVPPVPWRKVALGTLCLLALLGAAAAFAIPRISSSKQSARERERDAAARSNAAERRRIIHDQRATLGRAPRPDGHLSAAAELRARQGLLRTAERRITADVRRRAAAGELQGRASRTECVPAPSSVPRRGGERVLSRARDSYDCLAITSAIGPTRTNRAGDLGYPFRAVVDFRSFTFAWCKTNPLPGERAAPDPNRLPLLPRACQGP